MSSIERAPRLYLFLLQALLLALASTATQAAVVITAPLPPAELNGNRESACLARNLDDEPLEVSIEGFNEAGQRIAALTLELLPGSTRLVLPHEGAGPSARIASCQFSFSGRQSKVEGRIVVRDVDGEREVLNRLAR